MGERAIVNRVKKLKELERQQAAIQEQMDALKEEIKADMAAKGKDELQAGDFLIRWTKVLTGRFDAKRFQADHGKLYNQYIKQTESRRFSIV